MLAHADADGRFRLLVEASQRVALALHVAGLAPSLNADERFIDEAFRPVIFGTGSVVALHARDAAHYAELAGNPAPDVSAVAWLDVLLSGTSLRATLIPASGDGLFQEELIGFGGPIPDATTLVFPNVDPADAPDGLFRVVFERPVGRCNDWFEDPSTLLVPAAAGYVTRLTVRGCD